MPRWSAWLCVLIAGCGAIQPLRTTLFHATLPPGVEPAAADWSRLTREAPGSCDQLAAVTNLGHDEFAIWATGVDGSALLIARRTALGLEAQSLGAHHGPDVRATIRVLTVADARVVLLESSSDAGSTDRDAWLYVARGAEITPLTLDGAAAHLRVRAERQSPLEPGWSRESTFTATFESGERGLVVHEHESVREIAEGRPELSARSTYEVERARTLTLHGTMLTSDRASLFDER